jgi:type IV pilus assembly protein PilO
MSAKQTAVAASGGRWSEQFESMPLWQRVVVWVLILTAIIAAAIYFLFLPKYDEWSALDKQLKDLDIKLATAKRNAAELGRFQARLHEAEAQFKIAMRALPEREEIPSLLTNISKSGQDVGLEFLLFEPKVENKKALYAEIPVSMNIRGDYHNLAVFFDKVARLNRIVNITNITVDRGKDGRGLDTSCTAVTYKFIEAPSDRPAQPRPGLRPQTAPAPGAQDGKKNNKSKKLDL